MTLQHLAPPPVRERGFRRRAATIGLDVPAELNFLGIVVDLDRYDVHLHGYPVALSPRQIELLAVFLGAPNRVWHRTELAWLLGLEVASPRSIDVRLSRIRHTLGQDLFRSVRGRGWVLRELEGAR